MPKFISLAVLATFVLAPLQTQAATFSDFEQTGVVQVVAYNDDETEIQSGTAFFGSFTGRCLMTATHVLVDSEGNLLENIFFTINAGQDDEASYWAYVLIAYDDADVAVICVDDTTYPETFYHFFPMNQEAFDAMEVGDDLTTLGYPSFGQETVTAIFGQLTGFLDLLVENGLLKTDLDVSGGISGGPLLTEDKTVVGMIVAREDDDEGGTLSYATSLDFLNEVLTVMGETLVAAAKEAGYAPEDCEAKTRGTVIRYTLAGEDYYDAYCSIKLDSLKETLVATQFEHWCGTAPDEAYPPEAVILLNDETSSLGLDDWRGYLDALCGELDSDDVYNYFTPEQELGAVLIKGTASSAVYAVLADGKRHPFYNAATYRTWYGEDFSGVNTLTAEQLSGYSMGKPVAYHPGALIKIPSIPKVYVITDDYALRWITDEATAKTLFGDDWNTKVYDIPESLFPNYSVGDDLKL